MTDSIFLRPDVAARIEAFASPPPHSPPHLDDVIDDTGAVVWTALDALAAASPDLPPYLVLALAARPAADFLAHVGLPHAVAAHIDLLCPAMRPAAAAAADGSAPHIHLAAALVFPCLEATLAALATHRGVVSPPNMLKDLLLVPELADAEPARSRWLESLLASNRGVNVRNLVWHGFCPEPELSLPLLALLLAALAEALAIASATPGVLDALVSQPLPPPLESVVVDDSELPLDFAGLLSSHLSATPPPVDGLPHPLLSLHAMLSHPPRRALLDLAWSLGSTAPSAALAILLPALEHALRLAFALATTVYCAASLKAALSLAFAATDDYYTTLDYFLDPVVPVPGSRVELTLSRRQNRILSSDHMANPLVSESLIPPPVLDALHDILVVRAGPRLRSVLSHGELLPATLDAAKPQAAMLLRLMWHALFALAAPVSLPTSTFPSCMPGYVPRFFGGPRLVAAVVNTSHVLHGALTSLAATLSEAQAAELVSEDVSLDLSPTLALVPSLHSAPAGCHALAARSYRRVVHALLQALASAADLLAELAATATQLCTAICAGRASRRAPSTLDKLLRAVPSVATAVDRSVTTAAAIAAARPPPSAPAPPARAWGSAAKPCQALNAAFDKLSKALSSRTFHLAPDLVSAIDAACARLDALVDADE